MGADLQTILRLEVPFVVVLGERDMSVREVTNLVPGTIIELPKSSDEDLEFRINNRAVGTGRAVKIGENFGVRITLVGDPKTRIDALADGEAAPVDAPSEDDVDADALAAALLDGQT